MTEATETPEETEHDAAWHASEAERLLAGAREDIRNIARMNGSTSPDQVRHRLHALDVASLAMTAAQTHMQLAAYKSKVTFELVP